MEFKSATIYVDSIAVQADLALILKFDNNKNKNNN